MREHILDDLFLPHGIFNDVTCRYQVGCTPPRLVIEHIVEISTVLSVQEVQMGMRELTDQKRKLALVRVTRRESGT